MKHKNKRDYLGTILRVFMIVPAVISFSNHFIQLLESEVNLAKRHLLCVVMLVAMIVAFALAVWASLLGILFHYLISLSLSVTFSLCTILVLNLLLLVIAFMFLLRSLENLMFPATRQLVRKLLGNGPN